MCKMKVMNNKLFLTVIFIIVGLYQSIHPMANPKLNLSAQLNLWKTALPVQIPDLEAVGNNLGTKTLANLVPLYDQYWGYVGLLRAHGFHGYADNFRNTTMPENLRDHGQKTKIGSLIRTLENILSRSSINVVDVIQAWACIALLHEKRADHQTIVDYTARLKGRLTAAQMPSVLHESSHHEQEPKKVVVVPKSSPAFKAKSPIQDSKKTDDKAVGDKDVSKKDQAAPLGPVEGKKLSKQLCEQMFTAGNGRDALALMLSRHYADVAEDKLDKNDLLANIAFMYRCLDSCPVREQQTNIEAIVKDHAQGHFDEQAATDLLNSESKLPIGKAQSKVVDKQAQLKAPSQPKKASEVGTQDSTGSAVPMKHEPKPDSEIAAAQDVPVTTDVSQGHPVVQQVAPIAISEVQDKPAISGHVCVPIHSDEQSDMAYKADPQDLGRTIEILQARTEDLGKALKTMTEERDRSGEELEQLRAENTALRGKSAPEDIESATLKGENVRLASQVQELREQLLTANTGRDKLQAMYDRLIEEHRKLQVSTAESSSKAQSVSDDNHGGLKVLQQRMGQGDGDAVVSEALQAYFHVSESQVHAILDAQEEQFQQLLSSQTGSEHDQEA